MKPLGIVGPSDAGKTTLVERLVPRLSEFGRVATVKHIRCQVSVDEEGKDTYRHRDAGATETYGVMDDGSWFATGADRSLDDLLSHLATEYDYVVVEGYSDAELPTVALSGREHAGRTLQTAPDGESVDIGAVLTALEECEPFETLGSLVATVKSSSKAEFAGAIATFTGRVRTREGEDDDPTEQLEFEKYDDVAEEQMAAIRTELMSRDGVYDVRLHHRTGVVEAGDDIVFVVVLAGHREEAFRTVSDGIDRLKDEVPLFKKEITVEGEFWAHERDS